MPNNPAQRRAGAVPVPAANKIVRGEDQVVAIASAIQANANLPSASTPSTPIAPAIPPGVIVMWGGLLADIPEGWALCDGTGGTPDLRDRFIEGWTDAVDPGGTGGSVNHLHAVGTLVNSSESAGTPSGSVSVSGSTTDAHTTTAVQSGAGTTVLTGPASHTVGAPTGSFTGNALAGHTHTITGDTEEADGRPPFYKLAFIQKL